VATRIGNLVSILIAGLGLLFGQRSDAQSNPNPIPRIELKVVSENPVGNFGPKFGILLPMRCDSEGNVYIRPVWGKMNYGLAPVVRVSADGQHVTPVEATNAPEIKDAAEFGIMDFAVGKDGSVLELGWIHTKGRENPPVVVQIDVDQKSASLVRIETEFSPHQIAPLPYGMFLLTGVKHTTQGSGTAFRQSTTPMTAVFDSQGRFVREIQLPEDVTIPDVDSSNMDKPEISAQQQAVDLSQFAVADDGTIYLMRNGSPPEVYVISSAGEVVRSFEVTAPAPDAVATLFHSGGRLAFAFRVPDQDDARAEFVVRLVDPQDGRILWDYVGPKNMAGTPVCYAGREFTVLLHTVEHQLALAKFSAQ